MWDLAMELLGQGEPVPYERCVAPPTGARRSPPSPPRSAREWRSCWRGQASNPGDDLPAAVDCWRKRAPVPMASVRALGDAVIAHFDS